MKDQLVLLARENGLHPAGAGDGGAHQPPHIHLVCVGGHCKPALMGHSSLGVKNQPLDLPAGG